MNREWKSGINTVCTFGSRLIGRCRIKRCGVYLVRLTVRSVESNMMPRQGGQMTKAVQHPAANCHSGIAARFRFHLRFAPTFPGVE